MKRRDFIQELVDAGCDLKRHGGRHDIYMNLMNGKKAPVPRHSEVKNMGIGKPSVSVEDLDVEFGRVLVNSSTSRSGEVAP